jgi:hypothetical protein
MEQKESCDTLTWPVSKNLFRSLAWEQPRARLRQKRMTAQPNCSIGLSRLAGIVLTLHIFTVLATAKKLWDDGSKHPGDVATLS